jgi:hypothetical protein
MIYLDKDNDDGTNDAGYCRAKESEYAAKATVTKDKALKSAYEAVAREYGYRAIVIGSKKAALL